MSCWVCDQKKEWKQDKLNCVRVQAKQQAQNEGKTQVIWKEGAVYKYGSALPAGATAIEYISQYN